MKAYNWIRLLLLFHDVLYRFVEIPGAGPGFGFDIENFLTTPAPASAAAASSRGAAPGSVVAIAPFIASLPGFVAPVEVPSSI